MATFARLCLLIMATFAANSSFALSASINSGSTTVELCFRFGFDVNVDSSGGDFPPAGQVDDLGRSYFLARGVRFEIVNAAGTTTQFNADTTTGCETVKLSPFDSYRVVVFSEATFADGNTVKVMDDQQSKNIYSFLAAANLQPLSISSALTFLWPADWFGALEDSVPSVMGALVKTMTSHSMTHNEDYHVYMTDDPKIYPCKLSTACMHPTADDPPGPAVWLTGRANKWVISHEIGHLALFLRLGYGVGGSLLGAPPDYGLFYVPGLTSECADGSTHQWGRDVTAYPYGSEETGNAAFEEGFAHYYSASVWNRNQDGPAGEDGQDCQYDGAVDCADPTLAFDYCYTAHGLKHFLPTGFERDWLTTLWQIEREAGCGINFSKIIDIIEQSDPTRWDHGAALLEIAFSVGFHLSGDDYLCFLETLTERIKF